MSTRILAVEDDERIRTAVKLALEDEGWAVIEAATGEDAVAAVETATGRRVRLLLSDIAPEEGVAIQLFLFEPDVDGRAG